MTPTENITNPTWMTRHNDLCPTGWRLRLAYWGDTSKKSAYEEHVKACPACQAYLAEQAEKAEHPEVTDDETK